MDADNIAYKNNSICTLEKSSNRVYILTLTGDGEHRLNPTTIDIIIHCLTQVDRDADTAHALVVTNHGKFFSNGLDLKWLHSHTGSALKDKETLLRSKYIELLKATMTVRVPTIAAICGHASAGGFIWALTMDHRFMREDRGFLYMSEVDVGLSIGDRVMGVVRSKIDPSHLHRVVLMGTKYTASMASEAGFVDAALGNAAETLSAALNKAAEIGCRKWEKDVYVALRLSAFYEASRGLDHQKYKDLVHNHCKVGRRLLQNSALEVIIMQYKTSI